MGKISKPSRDLDLDRTMPNVVHIGGRFISYNIFDFQDPRSYIFWVIILAHTQTDRQTHRDSIPVFYDLLPLNYRQTS